jgi:hypothetical protein
VEVPEIIKNCDKVLSQMCKYYGYRETSALKEFNISSFEFKKIADILKTRGFSKTTSRGLGGLQLFATAAGKSFNALSSFEEEWLKNKKYQEPITMSLSEEEYIFLSVFPADKRPIPKNPDVLDAIKPHGLLNDDANRLYDKLYPRFLDRDKSGVMSFSINDIGLSFLKKYEYHLKMQTPYKITEKMVLKYFYKQNRVVTLDDLFEKYGVDQRILEPVNYLLDNDWLKEIDAESWQITNEGKAEQELRDKERIPVAPSTTTNITTQSGHVIHKSKVADSFNMQSDHHAISKKSSWEKWGKILAIIAGALTVIAATLKLLNAI